MSAVVVDSDVVSFAFKGDTRFRPYASVLTNQRRGPKIVTR